LPASLIFKTWFAAPNEVFPVPPAAGASEPVTADPAKFTDASANFEPVNAFAGSIFAPVTALSAS
jgi:hypothetical protein